MEAEYQHQADRQAKAIALSGGAISALPAWVLIVLLVAFGGGAAVLFVRDYSSAQEMREAFDRENLACRKSGGSFEYFRSQGYHCIGAKE